MQRGFRSLTEQMQGRAVALPSTWPSAEHARVAAEVGQTLRGIDRVPNDRVLPRDSMESLLTDGSDGLAWFDVQLDMGLQAGREKLSDEEFERLRRMTAGEVVEWILATRAGGGAGGRDDCTSGSASV